MLLVPVLAEPSRGVVAPAALGAAQVEMPRERHASLKVSVFREILSHPALCCM